MKAFEASTRKRKGLSFAQATHFSISPSLSCSQPLSYSHAPTPTIFLSLALRLAYFSLSLSLIHSFLLSQSCQSLVNTDSHPHPTSSSSLSPFSAAGSRELTLETSSEYENMTSICRRRSMTIFFRLVKRFRAFAANTGHNRFSSSNFGLVIGSRVLFRL